jgi:uncharacterized protein YpuA (DUF1002 family)
MTPEQIAALSLGWKIAIAAAAVGTFVGAGALAIYKAVKAAGDPIAKAAKAAASETLAQTDMLKELGRTGELTASEVRELGRRFTVSDDRNERHAGEVMRKLAEHTATLATHADAIHTNTVRFKPIEDSLARVQTVLNMRKTDEALGAGLVAALTPDPPAETPASTLPADEVKS